jgi:hypothetical protein
MQRRSSPHGSDSPGDVLRGFALFGILLVNMALFKAPAIVQATAPVATNPLDERAGRMLSSLRGRLPYPHPLS